MAQCRLPKRTIISRHYNIMSSGALSVLNTKTLIIIHSETVAAATAAANLIDTGK